MPRFAATASPACGWSPPSGQPRRCLRSPHVRLADRRRRRVCRAGSGRGLPWRYPVGMDTQLQDGTGRPSVLRRALAGLVLIVVLALAVKIAIGMVMAVFWTIVAVAAVLAVLWALKTLIW